MAATAPQTKRWHPRTFVRPTWDGPGGMREITKLAIPMIASAAVHSVNMFVDRTFLAHYSPDTFIAALQGGVLVFALMSLFFGTVLYSGTFIAQYTGAGAKEKVGASMWHGIYLAIIGGLVMTSFAPLGEWFFRLLGHKGNIPELEARYFEILTYGSVFIMLNGALSGFYSGRGKTLFVLIVNILVACINIVLDIWLIFSPFWFIEEGIVGAAWATVLSVVAGNCIYLVSIFGSRIYETEFRVRTTWQLDLGFLGRILRFGLPSGVHNFIDMVAFTTFLMIVGVFGWEAHHASNMAMSLNMLFFIPGIGFFQAVTILAGQYTGARDHKSLEKMVCTSAFLLLAYMIAVCYIYVGIPEYVLGWFRGGIPDSQWAELLALAKVLLIFVAIYSTCDGLLLVYSGALKGAGDTKFVMWVAIIFSQLLLTLPCILAAVYREYLGNRWGLMLCWTACSGYILFLGGVMFLRYWMGEWRNIDMIGQHGDAFAQIKAGQMDETTSPDESHKTGVVTTGTHG